jgi:hypothetical protein
VARRILLVSLLALALTACEIRTHLNIDAADLSNGVITAQLGFDEEFRDAMEEFGGGGDLLAEVESSAPSEGWEVDRFTEGDIEGVTLTQNFSSIEELRGILSGSSIAAGETGGWEDLTFTQTDDNTLRFEATLTAPGMEGTEDLGFEGIGTLLDFDFQIAVTFPGEVIEHNGVLAERTVTWDLDAEALADAELFAESRIGSPFPWAILGGILLGLVVIGVVAWSVISRRSRPPEVEITVEHEPGRERPDLPTDLAARTTEPLEVATTEE